MPAGGRQLAAAAQARGKAAAPLALVGVLALSVGTAAAIGGVSAIGSAASAHPLPERIGAIARRPEPIDRNA